MDARRRYLPVEEIRPMVDLASCYHLTGDPWMPYRIPSHHLILIERGRIRARTPDEEFDASAGDLICFRPAELNEYGTRGPTTYYQTHVEFAPPPRHRLTPWLDGIGPLPVRVPMGDAMAEMRGLFETLCIELGQVGVSHELRVRAAILEILAVVARVLAGSGSAPLAPARRRLDLWQRACVRLASPPPSGPRVSDLAAQFGFTADHFIRQFKRRFGVSPKAYQTQARMREAARLLRGTDGSVKSIAYALGFADPKSFARSFKLHLGVTPSDLRKSAASSPAAAEAAGPLPAERLFKLNQHVLPPHAGPDWLKKWRPRASRL